MYRYCFYIDGFNAYYALNIKYKQYKWLNYKKLAESIIGPKDAVTGVFYFTAFTTWKPNNVRRHQLYIKALRSVGVETIRGRFLEKKVQCHNCHQYYKTHEEKRTDVNIALKILTDAIDNIYDRAIIISADSDMLPAIEAVHKHAPGKDIGVMFPIGRNSYDLRQNCDFIRKMSTKLLQQSQFPDTIKIDGTIIKKPHQWK